MKRATATTHPTKSAQALYLHSQWRLEMESTFSTKDKGSWGGGGGGSDWERLENKNKPPQIHSKSNKLSPSLSLSIYMSYLSFRGRERSTHKQMYYLIHAFQYFHSTRISACTHRHCSKFLQPPVPKQKQQIKRQFPTQCLASELHGHAQPQWMLSPMADEKRSRLQTQRWLLQETGAAGGSSPTAALPGS